MSAHTPGPWIHAIDFGQVGSIESQNGTVIAQAQALVRDYDHAERNANARLIAAAPDLLAACQAQHHAIDVLMARLIALDPEFMPTKSTIWPALVAGSDAIAKATGGAS